MKDNITYKIESLLKKITKVGFCALSNYKAQIRTLAQTDIVHDIIKQPVCQIFIDTFIKSIFKINIILISFKYLFNIYLILFSYIVIDKV